MSSENALRKIIRSYIKKEPLIKSNIGEIRLNTNSIGEGGTALVYTDVDEKYALKLLVENIYENESNVYKRFKQEFINLIELSKTENRIVEFFDFGYIEFSNDLGGSYKIPYILMKKYRKSLKEEFKGKVIKTLEELDDFANKIIDLVEVIHSRSIIHRDLKPDNIFITEKNEFVLGDFGISWFDENIYTKLAKTEKGDRLANLEFSAPEQFVKGALPKQTMDLFAIGQLIQWCATGKTIKGLGSEKIANKLGSEFYFYDLTVESLVQDNPDNRIQSINLLRTFMNNQRKNSNHLWLRFNNKSYNQTCELIEDWKTSSIIPSGMKIENIFGNIEQQLLSNEDFIFLVGSLFWQVEESDIFNFCITLQLDDLLNFNGDDIFLGFEIEFNRLSEDNHLFDFKYFEAEEFRASTDRFDIYDTERNYTRHSCLYSEINCLKTNENYQLLIWATNGTNYRLKKNSNT